MAGPKDWFITYHLAELFLFLAILFLLIVIFYRCWNGCLELEQAPQNSGWRSKFFIRYIVGPGSHDPMETMPLTQAELTDDSDIRNRLVDACSVGPRLYTVAGPATALPPKDTVDDDGSVDDDGPVHVIHGKNLCVQECSLDITASEKLLKITR